MSGNLEHYKLKVAKVSKIWTYAKKWRETIAWLVIALSAVSYGASEGYNYWNQHKNNDINTIITIPDGTNLKSESVPAGQLATRFSDSSVRAELVVPDKVELYKLVKITSTDVSSYYDLLVMTVANNQIHFVETVKTARTDITEFVFVGPPGNYSIRLMSFDPNVGFKVTTGNVVIGQGPQPPPDSKPVVTFTVVPDTINIGQSAVLSWTVTDTTTVSLNGINVPLNGTQTVNPSSGVHTFTLTATGTGGTATKTVTLNVSNDNPVDPVFTGKYGFDKKTFEAWKQIKPEYKHFAAKLAENFESIAAQAISTNSYPTPNDMNKELQGRNRFTMQNDTNIKECLPFFNTWSELAKELNQSGKLLNTKEAYAEAYRETAAGLRAVK